MTYGEGFGRLASIVEDVWGDQPERPLLIAPDSAFDGPWLAEFLRRRPGPDVVTTHAYTLGAGVHWQAAQRSATRPSSLDKVGHAAEVAHATIAHSYADPSPSSARSGR